jgi:hypothetical protein
VIQVTPQMRILVAVEAVDFRRGIDGMAQLCRATLKEDPVHWDCLRLSEPEGEGHQALGVRRAGVLAVSQAVVAGTIPLLAVGPKLPRRRAAVS